MSRRKESRMDDRGKGLDALFRQHGGERDRRRQRRARKVAIAMIQDPDGDYALLRVRMDEGEEDVKVLGWLKDEESARELAELVDALGNDEASVEVVGGASESQVIESALNAMRGGRMS